MKPKLNTLISNRKLEMKHVSPKSRDRIRHRLHVLLVAKKMKEELAA